MQDFFRQRLSENFIQAKQRVCRVAAAATETRRERKFFIEMNPHTLANFGFLQKQRGGAMHEISRIHRQQRMVAREMQSMRDPRERQVIKHVDRVHDGFQFVKTIRASAENVKQQVDFAGRFFFQRHKKSANTNVGAVQSSLKFQRVSKIWKRLPGMKGNTSPPL